MRRLSRDERGTVLLLICLYAMVAAAMVVVAVDVSAVFLARRSLASTADGAALAAAQSVDRASFYAAGGADTELPLSSAAAARAVDDYLRETGATSDYPDLRASAGVSSDGRTVTVRLTRTVALPMLGWSARLSERFPDGSVAVTADANARAPVR